MNYRHAFHAGNFADVQKHAALTLLLRALQADAAPLTVIDTHAGAGLYDLAGDMARRSREAEQGIVRLLADPEAPAAFDLLKAAARAPGGALYPGSPHIAAAALRPQDRYVGFELRPDDLALLRRALKPFPGAEGKGADGYEGVLARLPRSGRALVLIDPPFERPDDGVRAGRAIAAVLRRAPKTAIAVWLPLKDLETFDAFLRDLQPPADIVAEVRLRPLVNPMRMNGSAMVFWNPPPGLAEQMQAVGDWIAAHAGEKGARAEVWRP